MADQLLLHQLLVACMQMVFDYYGEDIPQIEIAEAANTYYTTYTTQMKRAAHFSNLSTSVGEEMPGNITGYSARSYGYAAFDAQAMTIEDLKALLDQGEPTIVLMWYGPSKVSGHYRVVVGYNETHIVTHDPWNKDAWGGTYGGANTSIEYATFLDWWWDYSRNWGLWVSPWDVELQLPSTVIRGEEFQVTANIRYAWTPPFPQYSAWAASSCTGTITLQEGLELASGETAQHPLGTNEVGGATQTSWMVLSQEAGSSNVSVAACMQYGSRRN